ATIPARSVSSCSVSWCAAPRRRYDPYGSGTSCGLVVGALGIWAEPQLVLTLEPDSVVPELLMVALAPAPHCIASPAWISRLVLAVISIDWATMVMSSAGVWKQTSPSIA